MKVLILSKDGCGMCDVAEQLVKENNHLKCQCGRVIIHKKELKALTSVSEILNPKRKWQE